MCISAPLNFKSKQNVTKIRKYLNQLKVRDCFYSKNINKVLIEERPDGKLW